MRRVGEGDRRRVTSDGFSRRSSVGLSHLSSFREQRLRRGRGAGPDRGRSRAVSIHARGNQVRAGTQKRRGVCSCSNSAQCGASAGPWLLSARLRRVCGVGRRGCSGGAAVQLGVPADAPGRDRRTHQSRAALGRRGTRGRGLSDPAACRALAVVDRSGGRDVHRCRQRGSMFAPAWTVTAPASSARLNFRLDGAWTMCDWRWWVGVGGAGFDAGSNVPVESLQATG